MRSGWIGSSVWESTGLKRWRASVRIRADPSPDGAVLTAFLCEGQVSARGSVETHERTAVIRS